MSHCATASLVAMIQIHSRCLRPRWCWNIGQVVILSLYILPIFVQGSSQNTNFSYPVFRSVDDFITFEETKYNPDTLSFTVKPTLTAGNTTSSCLKLLYKDQVRVKSMDSNAVASFSTSFTFATTQTQDHFPISNILHGHVFGFMFNFQTTDFFISLTANLETKLESVKYLAVEFDTFMNAEDEDPSNNHIGVGINSCTSAYTYNLCEDERASCSFPWTGRTYTAWIDYHAPTKLFELWFANGSLASGALKPESPALMTIPELNLTDLFEDFMFVGFATNVGTSMDSHEIISWNFATHFEDSDTTMQTGDSSKGLINGVMKFGAAAISVVVVVSAFAYYIYKLLVLQNSNDPRLGMELLTGLRRFTYRELKKATKNFSEAALLGKGGSGSVYRGVLTGMVVAVKRLNHDSDHVQREFLAEASSISQVRHRNLVHLQGWCHEGGHFLLVFDYMSNGSLDEWLFPGRRRHPADPKYQKFRVLPWELRFSILAGVAAAVEYLHEEWVQCVLHRDIKSSNVMLDADFNAHLGDFGLARLMDHEKLEKTTMMAGTFGYMAPEMAYTGKATRESDVYSFGTLMLEVLCGRRPVNLQVEDPGEDFMLVQSVWRAYEDGNVLSAVDPGLQASIPTHNISCWPADEVGNTVNFGVERRVVALLQLGLHCCLSVAESRPSMRVVKEALLQVQSSTGDQEDPQFPAFQSMPPLPSSMPLLGDLIASMASFEDMDAGVVPEILSRQREVRRRFVTN